MLLILLVSAGLVISNAHVLTTEKLSLVRHKRLVGSNNTNIEEHPYQVAIEKNGVYRCGGAIISRHFILTTAHCLNGTDNSNLTVRSGTSKRAVGGSIHDVIARVSHESFFVNSYKNAKYDIAVVFVEPPFNYDATCKSIHLYENILSEDEVLNDKAIATGWGYLKSGGPFADNLQVLDMPLYSKRFCNANYQTFGGIYEGQICAGYIGVRNKEVCHGDSGGPLVVGGKLIGLISYGESNCGLLDHPAVFTEVAYYLDWIKQYVDFDDLYTTDASA